MPVAQPLRGAVYEKVIVPPEAFPVTSVLPSEFLMVTTTGPSGTPALSIVQVTVAPTCRP